MCQDCGCSITTDASTHHHHHEHEHDHNQTTIHANPQLNDKKTIDVITKILDKNDHEAAHNREHFERHNILALNLMSSPGSGKTTLLERTAELGGLNFCVIEGDLETNKDAERLQAKGVQAHQITTGTACHLDAFMVHKGLHHMDLDKADVCFVENVGNLVCPASYDVGTHLNIVLLSVPEGDDKVAKYPVMFQKADLLLITKSDLLPHFEFSIETVKKEARKLNPKVDILQISSKDDTSIQKWIDYINFKKSMRD